MNSSGASINPFFCNSTALAIIAQSKTSISGLIFRSSMTCAMYSTSLGSLALTLAGKLDEPVARLADSGPRASASQRASPDLPPRAPVEICLTIGHRAASSLPTISAKYLRSVVGCPASSRAWMWATEAPSAWQAMTSWAISSAVIGTCGVIALVGTFPVGASVMISFSTMLLLSIGLQRLFL
ncbi:MAG: hypothetical protein QM701_13645 [Propionivibrio sp.]